MKRSAASVLWAGIGMRVPAVRRVRQMAAGNEMDEVLGCLHRAGKEHAQQNERDETYGLGFHGAHYTQALFGPDSNTCRGRQRF